MSEFQPSVTILLSEYEHLKSRSELMQQYQEDKTLHCISENSYRGKYVITTKDEVIKALIEFIDNRDKENSRLHGELMKYKK